MKRTTLLRFTMILPPKLVKVLFARWEFPRWLVPPSDQNQLATWLIRTGFDVAETRFVRRDDGAEVVLFTSGMAKGNEGGRKVLDRLTENS
jgi:hypothetical protein